jgi:hypothetical protein
MFISRPVLLGINWLGRYARVVDHLAVKNVAQGSPIGGGSTLSMIAWAHIFIAQQSALTPTGCYAASANPWIEII